MLSIRTFILRLFINAFSGPLNTRNPAILEKVVPAIVLG